MVKTGKQRKDKFYQLAKETGYRSRAAFKLIQLNRKYEFLQRSRVLIDLCAAPGGWLQVAAQYMPISSLIVGVDLVPIKAIPKVSCLQDDITTASCRQALKKELKTWKADVVLHDGSPNMGKNWLHDAFQQAQLTLSALKVATEFLQRGGWFVTKVFRSKDYHALLWVFKQLFKKVYATKPQASRHESAEIFVVCQSYLAPDKLDPKLLNVKYVFQDVDAEPENKLNIQHPEKQKRRAEGYPEGDYTLYHTVNVSEFIGSETHLEILNKCSQLVLDDERIRDHKLTTPEIKECCKDIKVLGRKEFRELLKWRKKLREELHPSEKDEAAKTTEEIHSDEDEESKLQEHVAQLQEEEAKDAKKKKKKVHKERRKLQDRMNLKMVLPNDEPITDQDLSLFKLATMKNKQDLNKLESADMSVIDADLLNDRKRERKVRLNYEYYDKDAPNPNLMEDQGFSDQDDDDRSISSLEEYGADEEENKSEVGEQPIDDDITNPLVVDVEHPTVQDRRKHKTDMWFDKDIFAGLEDDADEDVEIEETTRRFSAKGSAQKSVKKEEGGRQEKEESSEDSEETDSDDSDDEEVEKAIGQAKKIDDIEIVPQQKKAIKRKKLVLDPEGLALASLMIQSKKTKRDIIDSAWNRFTFENDNLPDWFVKEEQRHYKRHLPVTKEMIQDYRDRLKEINDRTIKKVAEAKARKKRRTLKRLEKARKRAEKVIDSIDMTDQEKMSNIKSIYKKAEAAGNKKKDVTYMVSKKGLAGKKIQRPKGLKGRMKLVDPRMKKDHRKRKAEEKTNKKRQGGKRQKQKK